jgi:hypothetical protein
MEFDEIWNGWYATGGYTKFMPLNFLQLLISTSGAHEFVGWK